MFLSSHSKLPDAAVISKELYSGFISPESKTESLRLVSKAFPRDIMRRVDVLIPILQDFGFASPLNYKTNI